MRLSLVLPTLDERHNLERVARELLDEVDGLAEVIVVDDGSSDGTREVLRQLAASEPRVKVVLRAGAPSLPESLADGISLATGDAIGWLDADGIVPASTIARLWEAVREGADLAIASRFTPDGRIKGQIGDGWLKRALGLVRLGDSSDSRIATGLSWLLNTVLLPALTGHGIRDYTSGIVIARREALRELPLYGDYGEYFIGLTVSALSHRYRVVEIGYAARARKSGRSKTAATLPRLVSRGNAHLRAAWRARRR